MQNENAARPNKFIITILEEFWKISPESSVMDKYKASSILFKIILAENILFSQFQISIIFWMYDYKYFLYVGNSHS